MTTMTPTEYAEWVELGRSIDTMNDDLNRRAAEDQAAETAEVTRLATMPIPEAPVIATHTNHRSGIRTVTIACPYCNQHHTHGWPLGTGAAGLGHRVSHCYTGRPNKGYNLTIPDRPEIFPQEPPR